MAKSLVGRVENQKFAFFWLLIGGSIGNMLLILYSPKALLLFSPSIILSLLLAAVMANRKQRFKIGLWADLLLTLPLLLVLLPFLGSAINPWMLLPDFLVGFGCVLGIMNW